MPKFLRFFLGWLALPFLLSAALAQDVTLTSRDQSIELTGTLLGYDGEFYRIDTVYGELTVDGSGVLCSGPACPNLESYVAELTIGGSASMGRVLLPALIEGFARTAGYATTRREVTPRIVQYDLRAPETGDRVGVFTLKLGSSDEGFADLVSYGADMVMSRRLAQDSEIALAQAAEMGDLTLPTLHKVVALDALVAAVHKDRALAVVTFGQLADMAEGRLTDWQALTGETGPVHLVVPGNDDRQSYHGALQMLELDLPAALASDAPNPLAVTLKNLSDLDEDERRVPLGGPCAVAMAPTDEAVRNGDYPLTVPMVLYRAQRRLPKLGQEFWEFLETPTAQRVVQRTGFVDQLVRETPLAAQGERLLNAARGATPDSLPQLQAALEALTGGHRLSLSFRNGPTGLDVQSTGNLARLALMIDRGDLDGQRVLLAGFAGAEDAGLGLAENVRTQLLAQVQTDVSRTQIQAVGLGEALPITCPEVAWGQALNTRVEVWVW